MITFHMVSFCCDQFPPFSFVYGQFSCYRQKQDMTHWSCIFLILIRRFCWNFESTHSGSILYRDSTRFLKLGWPLHLLLNFHLLQAVNSYVYIYTSIKRGNILIFVWNTVGYSFLSVLRLILRYSISFYKNG